MKQYLFHQPLNFLKEINKDFNINPGYKEISFIFPYFKNFPIYVIINNKNYYKIEGTDECPVLEEFRYVQLNERLKINFQN